MKEFRSMYYGYIDSSIFLHSSILKLLSYIQSLIERNYLANNVCPPLLLSLSRSF